MVTFITIIHVIACLFLVLVVLLQAGKGGGMGVAFARRPARPCSAVVAPARSWRS